MTEPHLRLALEDAPAQGEVRLLVLAGHQIGLYEVGGEYYALADRCPHRGAPLCSSGRVVRGIALDDGVVIRGRRPALLRCPWHKWDFEIASGRCIVHPRLWVRRYRVEREGNELLITLKHPVSSSAAG